MRLIDADRLYAQVAETRYPTITGIMRMVQDAPTVGGWHDAHTDPPKAADAYLTYTNDGMIPAHYDALMYDNGLWFYTDNGQTVECKVDYWTDLPDPPEVKA